MARKKTKPAITESSQPIAPPIKTEEPKVPKTSLPGIACPHCGNRLNKVRNTRHQEFISRGKRIFIIRRERVCLYPNCNLPYTTVEKLEEDDPLRKETPTPELKAPPSIERDNPYL